MIKKFLILAAIDQITKVIFTSRDFFIGPLHIHPAKNFALSFGLNFGSQLNLSIVVIALVAFAYFFYRSFSQSPRLAKFAFILILSGAFSNILDRLRLGYVQDFLDLGLKFTFNLADIYIVVGLLILIFNPFVVEHE